MESAADDVAADGVAALAGGSEYVEPSLREGDGFVGGVPVEADAVEGAGSLDGEVGGGVADEGVTAAVSSCGGGLCVVEVGVVGLVYGIGDVGFLEPASFDEVEEGVLVGDAVGEGFSGFSFLGGVGDSHRVRPPFWPIAILAR